MQYEGVRGEGSITWHLIAQNYRISPIGLKVARITCPLFDTERLGDGIWSGLILRCESVLFRPNILCPLKVIENDKEFPGGKGEQLLRFGPGLDHDYGVESVGFAAGGGGGDAEVPPQLLEPPFGLQSLDLCSSATFLPRGVHLARPTRLLARKGKEKEKEEVECTFRPF
nr:hypothetical protein Iba_chr12aCG6230 [Ipomoea batatas]